MAQTGMIRLRVVFSKDNASKMIIPDGMPASLDDLVEEVKKTFKLQGNIRLQYMDNDFGDFVNITAISDIQDCSTIKIIQLQSLDSPVQSSSSSSASSYALEKGDSSYTNCSDSDDTVIISSPDTIRTRTQPWPKVFPIPRFSYETELQLEKRNKEYQASKTMLTVSSKMKSDILQKLAEEIFKFKAYPSESDFSEVSEALIQKHHCLKEPGSYNGCYGWKQRLKYKMGNYRTELKLHGCAELAVNSFKAKSDEDAKPAKNVKKPRRAEVNYYPTLPIGETRESLEQERTCLLREAKKKNNEKVVQEMMTKTFAYRRQEVVQEQPKIVDFIKRWPALFKTNEINAEFLRITTVPLKAKFFAELDRHSNKLIKLFKDKGGATRNKINNYIEMLDETCEINVRRECVLRSLIIYLGEDVKDLIKEFSDIQADEAVQDLQKLTLAIFVVRNGDARLIHAPEDVGIIIEGVEVINELPSVASAVAMLFGLIYALNLSYPKELKCTFEVIQKVFMQLEPQKKSCKVQTLCTKLLSAAETE